MRNRLKALALYLAILPSCAWSQQGILAGILNPQAPVAAEPTFTEVNSCTGTTESSGTTLPCTFGSLTAGNAVVCGGATYLGTTATFTSVVDNAGTPNTYTLAPSSPSNGAGATPLSADAAYLLNLPASPGLTITATVAVALTYQSAMSCIQFHRSSGTWAFDKDAAGNSGASQNETVNLPSITPSVSGELIVAVVGIDTGTLTAGGAYTTGPALTSLGATEYNLSGSSGAQTPNWSISSNSYWNTWIGAFK